MADDKLIPPDSWRQELMKKAQRIARQADIEKRNHYTPEEVDQMESVMKDFVAALTVEKIVRDEGEDEG